jgi:hypothetical protein
MTNTNEGLLLDPDGIPILTDLIHEDTTPGTTGDTPDSVSNEVSAEELASLLLNNNTFRKRLDEIAEELTRSIRQQLELSLRPTLEEAVSLAFDDSSKATRDAIRKHLETTLPGLLARTLQD